METTPSAPQNIENVDLDEDDEDISITEGSDDDQEVPDIHFTEESEDVKPEEEDEKKIDTMDEKDITTETSEERESTLEKEEAVSSKTPNIANEDHTMTLKEEEDPHPIASATIPLVDLHEQKEQLDIKMEEKEKEDQLQDDSETVSSLE